MVLVASSIVIYLIALSLAFASIAALYRRRDGLNACGGILVGYLYFVLIPILLIPIAGPISLEGISRVSPYSLYDQNLVLVTLLFGVIALVAFMLSKVKHDRESFQCSLSLRNYKTALVVACFFLIVSFIGSGKLSGGHWAAHNSTGNPLVSIATLLMLVSRVLVYAFGLNAISRSKWVLRSMFIYTLLDVLLTGNRIPMLYFVVVLVYSRSYSLASAALFSIFFLPICTAIALFYPAIRGVLWNQFGGLGGIWDAIYYVATTSGASKLKLDQIYHIFEASNLTVAKYIYSNYKLNENLSFGETVFLKPIALFIPREIWIDKPEGLGIRLGREMSDIEGLSLNSLYIGEFWANFDWLSLPFWGLFLMILVISSRFKSNVDGRLLGTFTFLAAFSSWRHEFNYFFFTLFFGLIFIFFILVINKIRMI